MQEFICASMECSGFFISFYDSENSCRRAAYVWGDGKEIDISELPPMPITMGGGPNSQAILEKRTIITDHYWDSQKKRPHVVLNEDGRDPMSSLVVPMIVQDRVTGTLEVQAFEENAFHREQAIALEMAANLAAVAIENVRLIEFEAKARVEAEAANRMKDEFLSVLSHELRTPLNAMLGWVRILRGGNVDEARAEKALEIIERNTRQQSSLIEDLLDVSRIISGKMKVETELIDLVPSLHQVADSVRPLTQAKSIDFEIIGSIEPLYLKGDAVRLQQVITNLLQNAGQWRRDRTRVPSADL
jgi:signal transduction histidine kinase